MFLLNFIVSEVDSVWELTVLHLKKKAKSAFNIL